MTPGRILRGALATFGARLFSGGIRYFTAFAIVRLFGAAAWGEFAVGSVLLVVLVTIASAGAPSGLPALVSDRIERFGKGAAGALIRHRRKSAWLICAGLELALWAVGRWAPEALGAASGQETMLGVALSLPFLAVANVLEAGTRGLRTTRYEIFLRTFVQPVTFLALLAGLGRGSASILAVWIAFALSLAIEVVLAEVIVRRLFPATGETAAPAPELRRYLVHDVVVIAAGGLDLWLVGHVGEPAAAGHYGAALRTVEVLVVLLGSFQLLLVPSFAGLKAQTDGHALTPLIGSISRTMFLLSAIVAGVLIFGAGDVLGLFGAEFLEAVPALRLLAAMPLLTALFAPAHTLLLLDDPFRMARIRLVAAVVAGGLFAICWAPLGLLGAAVASAGSTLVVNVWILAARRDAAAAILSVRAAGLVAWMVPIVGGGLWALDVALAGTPFWLRLAAIGIATALGASAWLLLPAGRADRESFLVLVDSLRRRVAAGA